MKAMILAAGLGTRLKPYSEQRPKPLFPVLGKPLVCYLLEQLRGCDFGPVVVNAHHLREQFVSLLGGERDVVLQLEESILGTGGGLRKAMPGLADGVVLVVNGDIIHSYDLTRITLAHEKSGCPVSLVVHDHFRFNNVLVSRDGFVKGFRATPREHNSDTDHRLMAFTGIHVLDSRILQGIPEGCFYDVIDLYRALIASGVSEIAAIEMKDGFWTDIGTPADYLDLHRDLLTGVVPQSLRKLFGEVAGAAMIMPDVDLGRNVTFKDWVYIGAGARIGSGAKIARSVVWDGAVVEAGASIEDRIIVS